jgi:AlwI restriction endonuclease
MTRRARGGGDLKTTWDLGNTTVRNPGRLLAGLQVFAEHVDGHVWDLDEQVRVWQLLKDAELINSETEDERASLGRKWFAALKQLGFVALDEADTLYITDAGRALMDHAEVTDIVFLRQLVKYKIASPLEQTRLQGFNFRPFITFLRFLKLAHENGLGGLTRDEVALFVVTTMTEDSEEIERVFWQRVVSFREGYEGTQGRVAKGEFVGQQLDRYAPAKPKHSTLFDYADSSARYARISGLVVQSGIERGHGGKFRIAEGRHDLVTRVLDGVGNPIPDEFYVQTLHDSQQPFLPIDDATVVAAEIEYLESEIAALGERPAPGQFAQTMLAQQAQVSTLRKRRSELNEFRFYRAQHSWEQLADIKELLTQIKTGTLPNARAYAPAYLEWGLWRLLLAINDIRNPVADTRGFRVDDEFNPINHAAGGAADCTFAYDTDAIIVEATLTTSSRQVVAENESVRRHVAKAADSMPEKDVLGLFVAKRVDPNTYDEFHLGRFRLREDVQMRLSIVPLTLENVIDLITAMEEQQHMLTSEELIRLLKNLDALRRECDDGVTWRNQIRQVFPQVIADLSVLRA